MAAAKSIRTEPRSEAVEGAWRIRTAVPAPSTPNAYERLSDSHPIHTAGLYFACRDPEAEWIADMEADAERVEAAQSTEGKVS